MSKKIALKIEAQEPLFSGTATKITKKKHKLTLSEKAEQKLLAEDDLKKDALKEAEQQTT